MRRLAVAPEAAAFLLIVGAFVAAELWIGARAFSLALCLFALLAAGVQTLAGALVLRAGGMEGIEARLPAAYCVGFVCLALSMYALTSLFTISALAAFWVCSALVLLAQLIAGDRRGAPRPERRFDVLVALLLTLAIAVLTREPVASAHTLATTGALPIWSDFFLHGVTISSFGGPFASGIDMELPGVARVFYHYAPFLIPAAFQPVSGLTGLALSTSVLLPMGVLTAALGCYAFAVQLGGRAAGVLAVSVVAAVPAYRVPLHSGWLDFYWMLLTAPGVGYAIGIAMVVGAVALLYVERGGARAFVFGALLSLSIILVRVHFFMLLAPALALYVGLRHRWAYGRATRIGAGLVLLAVVAAALASPGLRAAFMAHADPFQYLDFALRYTQFRGHALSLAAEPSAAMLVVKAALALVAVLGAYALLYPLLAGAAALRFGWRRSDLLAAFMVLTFVALMLLAPTAGNGDFTEYKHRHFPLLYVIVAVFTVVHAWRLAAGARADSTAFRHGAFVLSLALLAAAALAGRGLNPAKPDVVAMPWGGDFHDQHVAPGLIDAARFMRAQSQVGDVMALGGDAVNGQSRVIVDLISLTDIPAFLARAELRTLRGGCVARTVAMRTDALGQIARAANWPEARGLLRDNAIRWFVVPAGETVAWDPLRQAAVHSGGGMSVYDAGPRAPEALPPTEPCR